MRFESRKRHMNWNRIIRVVFVPIWVFKSFIMKCLCGVFTISTVFDVLSLVKTKNSRHLKHLWRIFSGALFYPPLRWFLTCFYFTTSYDRLYSCFWYKYNCIRCKNAFQSKYISQNRPDEFATDVEVYCYLSATGMLMSATFSAYL